MRDTYDERISNLFYKTEVHFIFCGLSYYSKVGTAFPSWDVFSIWYSSIYIIFSYVQVYSVPILNQLKSEVFNMFLIFSHVTLDLSKY